MALELPKLKIGYHTNLENIKKYPKKYNVLQTSIGDLTDPNYLILKDFDYDSIKIEDTLIFIHSKYCFNISKKNINYAIKEESTFLKNIKQETGIVIHLSKNHFSTREEGLLDISKKLTELYNKYLKDTNIKIILETSHNSEHLGSLIDDFALIFKNLDNNTKKNIGICLDTSHIFLAGYPFNKYSFLIQYLAVIEQKIGLEYISLIHLNDIDSFYFGKHTEHISVNDERGKIFFNNQISLNIFVKFALFYEIPIILERNSKNSLDSINKEIIYINKIIKNETFNTKKEFIDFIKNIICIRFCHLLFDYYELLGDENKLSLIKKIKQTISKDYNFLKLTEFKEFKNYFDLILNKDYEIFNKFENDSIYNNIKNLMTIKFVGKETANNLIKKNITTIDELFEIIKTKNKKIFKELQLNSQQEKAIKNYKFIKSVPINKLIIISNIIIDILSKFNVMILGSLYRYTKIKDLKKDLEDNCKNILKDNATQIEKIIPLYINDVDLLIVIKDDKDFFIIDAILKKQFMWKADLFNGNKKKSYIMKYNNKNNNIYFILDIYICKPEEELFMKIFLAGPKEITKKIYTIARSKGYKMNQYGIINIKDKSKIKINNLSQLNKLLDIKLII